MATCFTVTSATSSTSTDPWPTWTDAYYTADTATTWNSWTYTTPGGNQVRVNVEVGEYSDPGGYEIRQGLDMNAVGSGPAQIFRPVAPPEPGLAFRGADPPAMYELPVARPTPVPKEADKRSLDLLMAFLDAQQRKDFEEHEFFIVTSANGKKYRIRKGRAYNVDDLTADGNPIRQMCFVADGVEIPMWDHMLMQKLILEIEPEAALRAANVR